MAGKATTARIWSLVAVLGRDALACERQSTVARARPEGDGKWFSPCNKLSGGQGRQDWQVGPSCGGVRRVNA
jgi:hypothetical protein